MSLICAKQTSTSLAGAGCSALHFPTWSFVQPHSIFNALSLVKKARNVGVSASQSGFGSWLIAEIRLLAGRIARPRKIGLQSLPFSY